MHVSCNDTCVPTHAAAGHDVQRDIVTLRASTSSAKNIPPALVVVVEAVVVGILGLMMVVMAKGLVIVVIAVVSSRQYGLLGSNVSSLDDMTPVGLLRCS